jgi:hypothetical protein
MIRRNELLILLLILRQRKKACARHINPLLKSHLFLMPPNNSVTLFPPRNHPENVLNTYIPTRRNPSSAKNSSRMATVPMKKDANLHMDSMS